MLEGEQRLLRNHKAFPSNELFQKALRAATTQEDKLTLERLAKAAELHNKEDWLAQLEVAKRLGGKSRAMVSDMSFRPEQMTPENYARIKEMERLLHIARLLSAPEVLEQYDDLLATVEFLDDEQRRQLEQSSIKLKAELESRKSGDTDEAIKRLLGERLTAGSRAISVDRRNPPNKDIKDRENQ